MVGMKKYLLNTVIRSALIVLFALFMQDLVGQDTIFIEDFDYQIQNGWDFKGSGTFTAREKKTSWSIGEPHGGRGYNDIPGQKDFEGNPDPINDHTITNSVNKVAGQGLFPESSKEGASSYYNRANEWIVTPAINCSDFYNIYLSFWRWANFEDNYDKAFVEVSTNGIDWISLSHEMYPQDTSWVQVTFDISAYADRQPQVYIRWRSESDRYIHYSGWNIDDVVITGDFTKTDVTSNLTTGSNSEPKSIASTIDSYNERASVVDFVIIDNASGDNRPTLINGLHVVPGVANNINDWTQAIKGAFLEIPSAGQYYIGTINEAGIDFDLSVPDSIQDGSSKSYQLSIFLKQDLSGINDNQMVDFLIDYVNIDYDPEGSFIGSGSVSSDAITIDVKATKLVITTLPSSIAVINRNLFPTLKITAQDENGNNDLNFDGIITLENSANLGMINNSVTAIQGTAKFTGLKFTELGGPVYLTSINHASPQLSNDSMIITIVEETPVYLFQTNFDDGLLTGWTTGANGLNGASDNRNSWQVGIPNGGMGYNDLFPRGYIGNPDPHTDHTTANSNNVVIGQGLWPSSKFQGISSYYNQSNEWIQTPAINCSGMVDVELAFWRWANFEDGMDKAYVEVSNDSISWNQLSHPLYPQDNNWTEVVIDISEYANNQPEVYIRWRSESSMINHYAGWNIDDVTITAIKQDDAIWTGVVSSDWDNPSNWDIETVPTSSTVVTIPSGLSSYPEIKSFAECKSMDIKAGADLVIQETGSLEVIGDMVFNCSNDSSSSILDLGVLNVYGKTILNKTFTDRGWVHVSSPVENISTKDFSSKVYYYDEPVASVNWDLGWINTDGTIQNAKGYNFHNTNTKTIQLEGQLITGYQEVPVTFTDSVEIIEHEGWNLIGNPYPSGINWDAADGWVKENIENAIYIWDPVQENYKSYVNGVGTNGGSAYIAPMTAFFIKASKPGKGKIGMDNRVRTVVNQGLPVKSTLKGGSLAAEISLTLSDQQYSDETVIRFTGNATVEFDDALDAYKMFSSKNYIPQIYSQQFINEPLAINSLPIIEENISIPIYIKISNYGEYTLSINTLAEILQNRNVLLEDRNKGEFINMKDLSSYTFISNGEVDENRFILHISFPLDVQVATSEVSCNGASDGSITLDINGGVAPYDITWSTFDTVANIENLPGGEYEVIIKDQIGNVFVNTIIISEPETISVASYAHNPSEIGAYDGLIDNVVEGGILPYTYNWSTNSSSSEDLIGISAGAYIFTIVDGNGCSRSDTIVLEDPSQDTYTQLTEEMLDPDIYSHDKTLIIDLHQGFYKDCLVEVFSMEGKIIYRETLLNVANRIQLNESGLFVVKLTVDGKTYSRKLYL